MGLPLSAGAVPWMGRLSQVTGCRQAPTQSSQVPRSCEEHVIVPLPALHPPRELEVWHLGSDVTQRLSSVSVELWPPVCFKKKGNIEMLVTVGTQKCLPHLLVVFFKF